MPYNDVRNTFAHITMALGEPDERERDRYTNEFWNPTTRDDNGRTIQISFNSASVFG